MRVSVAIVALAILTAPASAQDKMIVFSMTAAEATTVINALGEHPWKDVNPLMQKLIAQANDQLRPPPPAPPPPPSEKQE